MKETENKVLDVEILTDEAMDEKAKAKEEKKRLKEEKAKAKAEKKAEKAATKAVAKAEKAAAKEAKDAQKAAAKAAKEAMAEENAAAEDVAVQGDVSVMQTAVDMQDIVEVAGENDEDKVTKKKEKISIGAVLALLKDGLAGGGKGSRSIMQTLFLAFMVPVVLMIILGIVAYNMASSAVLSKYSESAVATVSAVGN